MAPLIAQFLVFLIMMPAMYNGIASSLHVEIVPRVLDERISDEVKITCVANDSPYWTGDIVFFQLSKKGEHPIAIVEKTKLTHGPSWKTNMEAEGNLNEVNITKSFLTLTIINPGMNDAGLYSCQLFYRDGFGELKEGHVYGNLTVTNDDDKLVIQHLVKSLKSLEAKVIDQEKQLQEQTKHSKEQDAKGHDYNTSTGVYTAPRRGLYLFTLVAMTHGYDWAIDINLQANGHTVASLYAHDKNYDDQSSVSTVVSLQAGTKSSWWCLVLVGGIPCIRMIIIPCSVVVYYNHCK